VVLRNVLNTFMTVNSSIDNFGVVRNSTCELVAPVEDGLEVDTEHVYDVPGKPEKQGDSVL